MQGLLVYKGKYGATEQYAEWAAKELNIPLQITHEWNEHDLAKADYLVIGTSVYIGALTIKEWIKNNLSALEGKKIFMFIVCGTPVNEREKLLTYVNSSLPEQISKACKFYFLPGRLVYKKLSWSDKLLLRIGFFFSSRQQKKRMKLKDYDSVKKENLAELIGDVRKTVQSGKRETAFAN